MLPSLKKTCDILPQLNGRGERHGKDEIVPAFDVRLRCSLTRNQVNKLTGDEQFWHRIFNESKVDGDKNGLRDFAPLTWKAKFEHSTVAVKVGLHDKEIKIGDDCVLKRFVFTGIDGGQTAVEFTVSTHANMKNVEMLLFIGYKNAALEMSFGEKVIESEQRELELDGDEDDDEEDGDDKPLSTAGESDDPRPVVN